MIQPTTDQLADIGREVVAALKVSPTYWRNFLPITLVAMIEEFQRPTHFVTFGVGSPEKGCYALIHADSHTEANAAVFAVRGKHWAFIYPIEDLEGDIAKGWLDGGEVPL